MDRLGDERRDRVGPFAQNRLLERPRRRQAGGLARPRTLIAVRVAGRHVNEAGHARLEHVPVGGAHRRRAHRLQRQAVVGLVAGDDFDFRGFAARLPVEARGLERRLICLGPPGSEKDAVHRAAGQADQTLRQADRRHVRRAGEAGAVGQRGHLRRRRVGELGAAVAGVDVPQAGQPVDVGAAVHVFDRRALAAHPDHRPPAVDGMVQRMDQMLPVGGDEIVRRPRHASARPAAAACRGRRRSRWP